MRINFSNINKNQLNHDEKNKNKSYASLKNYKNSNIKKLRAIYKK